MKKIVSSLMLLISFIAFAKAQTQQGNITRQDALDFINKVINEYPKTSDTYRNFLEKATLVGCTLYVIRTYYEDDSAGGYNYTVDSVLVDLAASSYRDEWNINCVGYRTCKTTTYKNNGKINKQETEANIYRNVDVNGKLKDFSEINFLGMNSPSEYNKRFHEAFYFLVKACGGGKEPVKDKF